MACYLGVLEQFDAAGDDWAQYLQRFEYFLIVNEIQDEHQSTCSVTLDPQELQSLMSNQQHPHYNGIGHRRLSYPGE